MDDDEDAILVAAVAGIMATRAGALGAWLAARRLPKDVHQVEMTVASPSDQALDTVIRLLGSLGQVIGQTDADDRPITVRALVGAGHLNLNLALLTVTLTPTSSGCTRVHIRGVAKEGLIKQRAGEKAAQRFASMLNRPGS